MNNVTDNTVDLANDIGDLKNLGLTEEEAEGYLYFFNTGNLKLINHLIKNAVRPLYGEVK